MGPNAENWWKLLCSDWQVGKTLARFHRETMLTWKTEQPVPRQEFMMYWEETFISKSSFYTVLSTFH